MVNYSNSKIYKICSFQTDLIYIGSTTQPLSKRLAKHRSDYNVNRGISSKEILQYSDAQIILLESINCENKDQLHAIERRYIENNNCCNKVIPSRKYKEYQKTEKYKEYQKEYREQYKQTEKYKKSQKKYHESEKYKKNHKKSQKEYDQKNKERKKKQYQQNKEQRLKYQKQSDKFRRSEIGIFLRSFNFKCSCEV